MDEVSTSGENSHKLPKTPGGGVAVIGSKRAAGTPGGDERAAKRNKTQGGTGFVRSVHRIGLEDGSSLAEASPDTILQLEDGSDRGYPLLVEHMLRVAARERKRAVQAPAYKIVLYLV